MDEFLKTFILQSLPDGLPLKLSRIYTDDELGRSGLVKKNPVCALSWEKVNSVDLLMPTLVIRTFITLRSGTRRDALSKTQSHVSSTGLWFYGETGWADLRTASQAIYSIIADKTISGVGYCFFSDRTTLYAPDLNNAYLLRDNYTIKGRLIGNG